MTFAGVYGCGGTLTTSEGYFHSPDHPNQYQSNLICEWLIRVPLNERIRLKFDSLDIEHHSTCRWDFIEVRITCSFYLKYKKNGSILCLVGKIRLIIISKVSLQRNEQAFLMLFVGNLLISVGRFTTNKTVGLLKSMPFHPSIHVLWRLSLLS